MVKSRLSLRPILHPRESPEETNFKCLHGSKYCAIILYINVHIYTYRVWIFFLTTNGIVLCKLLYTLVSCTIYF